MFNVFLLNILCSLLLCIKCLSINFKNFLPTFILAGLQKGGLNHIIFIFYFLTVLLIIYYLLL